MINTDKLITFKNDKCLTVTFDSMSNTLFLRQEDMCRLPRDFSSLYNYPRSD